MNVTQVNQEYQSTLAKLTASESVRYWAKQLKSSKKYTWQRGEAMDGLRGAIVLTGLRHGDFTEGEKGIMIGSMAYMISDLAK